jgi:Cytochrome c554 and c-prime
MAKVKHKILIAIAAGVLFFVGLYFLYPQVHSRIIFGLREDFRSAVPYQVVPVGIDGIRAEDCAKCHRAIYDEWRTSIHSHAYADPFFQAYWNKDEHIWICLNCHTPLVNQQPNLVGAMEKPGRVETALLTPNPRYDADFQEEGITCAACHVRDGVIEGPYADSKAPHPTRYSDRFTTTKICYTCHQVPSDRFQFYNIGPCATFPEFEAGPYAKIGTICQDCHMPLVKRAVAKGGPVRQHARRHLWRGGHDPQMIRAAVNAVLTNRTPTEKIGREVDYTLTFYNAGAGHKVPTGDPDRYFTIEFVVKDKTGQVLKRRFHTIGRWIIWKPVILEVYHNRLMPFEYRDYNFSYRLPKNREGLTLTARVRYHIMTPRAHQRLIDEYDLKSDAPYEFIISEEIVSLDSSTPSAGPVAHLENGIQVASIDAIHDPRTRCRMGGNYGPLVDIHRGSGNPAQ